MRKITKQAAEALRSFGYLKSGNMLVDNGSVFLHGNQIAHLPYSAIDADGNIKFLLVCDSGWATPTTRERINGLFQAFNLPARVYQKKGTQYLYDGKCTTEWSRTWARVSK